MYNKMLVPLDTSGFAECVLEHVKEIATTRAIPDVVLLSVVEPVTSQTMAYMGSAGVQAAEERATKGAFQYLDRIDARLALEKSKTTTVVLKGPAAEVILDYIENNGVDILVLSSHGRSGVSRWLLGGTVDKLLRRSPVPVFLVPSVECRVQTQGSGDRGAES
ncbi:MAG: universal stress protein [Dehalococcoidia bacterium]|nr:universal stress protein [Dehalococcoidia bacterium]